MHFLIQDNGEIDNFIVKDVLLRTKSFNSFDMISAKEITSSQVDSIPVGTIEFVEKWLYLNHHIPYINPIEVPVCLRTPEFLKRDYSIVEYHNLPKTGNYFIKDVSRLKQMSYCGDISCIINSDEIDKNHLYQVSAPLDVLSEYRVYIINGKIEVISHYDGNPLIFPDVALINKANIIWSNQKDYPLSGTMDVMVTTKGTAICECHPFVSVGLYSSLWGSNLLFAYKNGIDYVLNHNFPLFKN